MPFFSLSECSLPGFLLAQQVDDMVMILLRCSILRLPPALSRRQVIFVVITAAATWSLIIFRINNHFICQRA